MVKDVIEFNMLGLIVLNAFNISRKAAPVIWPLSTLCKVESVKCARAVIVDHFGETKVFRKNII